MRKLIIAGAMALALGTSGCANLQKAWDTITTTQVTPQTVIVAANTFNALEASATNYLRLARCTGSNGPVCRDPAASRKIISAVRAGRVARTNLEQFFKDHPGQLGPSGLYDAFRKAIDTLNDAVVAAGVGQ